jgi:hypothetical protein
MPAVDTRLASQRDFISGSRATVGSQNRTTQKTEGERVDDQNVAKNFASRDFIIVGDELRASRQRRSARSISAGQNESL